MTREEAIIFYSIPVNTKLFYTYEVNIGTYENEILQLEKNGYHDEDTSILKRIVEIIKQASIKKSENKKKIVKLLSENTGEITTEEKFEINKLEKEYLDIIREQEVLGKKLSLSLYNNLIDGKTLLY